MPPFRFRHVPDAVLRAAGLRRTKKTIAALALLDDRDRHLEDYLSATNALAGHAHVAPPAPATTVVAETTFGLAPSVGGGLNYAREGHTHGTPANPVTAVFCEINRNVNQSIPENVDEQVQFTQTTGTSTVDLRSGYSIVIQTTGRYLVWLGLKWAAQYGNGDYGGYRSAHVKVNGGEVIDDHDFAPVSTGPASTMTHWASRVMQLNAGDVVTASALHSHPFTNLNLDLENPLLVLGVCLQR